MSERAARLAGASLLVAVAAGCPRLPPPPPRPAVSLIGVESARAAGGLVLRARFQVHNRGAIALVLSAVDWEVVVGDRALVRGRAHAHRRFAPGERAPIEVAILVPAPLVEELRSGEVRLRGMIHLEDPAGGAGAPAPFDEAAEMAPPHGPTL